MPTPLEAWARRSHRSWAQWIRNHLSSRLSATIAFIALAFFVIPPLVLVLFRGSLFELCSWTKSQGTIGELIFLFFMSLWSALCLPVTPFEIAAGYLFGFWKAFVIGATGKTIASAIAFFLVRIFRNCDIFGLSLVSQTVDSSHLIQGLKTATKKRPWQLLLLIRITIVPSAFKNYGLSMLPCSFKQYIVTAFVGAIPFSLVWAQVGSMSSSLLDALYNEKNSSENISSSKEAPSSYLQLSLMVVGCVASIVVLHIVRIHAMHEIQRMRDEGSEGERVHLQTLDISPDLIIIAGDDEKRTRDLHI